MVDAMADLEKLLEGTHGYLRTAGLLVGGGTLRFRARVLLGRGACDRRALQLVVGAHQELGRLRLFACSDQCLPRGLRSGAGSVAVLALIELVKTKSTPRA